MDARDTGPVVERAALLLVTAAVCFACAWRIEEPLLEWYYAAGARSMAMSWHNFAYGAFDPDGLITLDKLPGAIWLQALSVRLFGARPWAVVLPQVIEGALTVVALHRAVRRLFGATAGLTAALVFAVSPVTVALNRGNIPDTLLTLLLVLAADATSSALVSGRSRSLVLAGVYVGLAFQTKMMQAWLVLPALGAAYALAGPGSLERRFHQLLTAGAATLVVSLSWMTWVSLMPAAGRPHVDGSIGNSIFEQVFVYNGLRRIVGWSPLLDLARIGLGGGAFEAQPAGWDRLITGSFGRAAGWLLPTALLTLVVGFVSTRRAPRTDPIRAGLLLWGTWLIVHVVTFSATSTGWPYYTAILSPAVAAVIGAGVRLLRERIALGWRPLAVLAIVIAATTLHGSWLLPREGVGITPWLRPLLLGVGVAAVALLAAAAALARTRAVLTAAGALCGAIALLLLPVVASASLIAHRMGPFDTPYEPLADAESNRAQNSRVPDLARFAPPGGRSRYLLAAQPAALAARFVFVGGHRVVPIGGLTGTHPEPSVSKLAEMIGKGEVHLVIAVPSADPRYRWIGTNCDLRRRFSRAELFYCRGPRRDGTALDPP